MKTLTKFALTAVMLITTLTAQTGWVSGYYRSSGTYVSPYYRSDYGSVGRSYGSGCGYVYRNPRSPIPATPSPLADYLGLSTSPRPWLHSSCTG